MKIRRFDPYTNPSKLQKMAQRPEFNLLASTEDGGARI
jgi:hypothetical protein